MDGHPSDQLTGKSTQWHTVSIVIGPNPRYLADFTANLLPKPAQRPIGVVKWSANQGKRKSEYRMAFANAFRQRLPCTGISAFRMSSTEDQICRIANLFYIENAANIERVRDKKGRESCRFHFAKGETPTYVDIENNRGAVVLWMARVIHYMTTEFIERKYGPVSKMRLHSDWLVRDDPGPPHNAPAATVFATIVDRITASKVEIRLSKTRGDSRELLADNIAGWANNYATSHATSPSNLTRAFHELVDQSLTNACFEWAVFDAHIQIVTA